MAIIRDPSTPSNELAITGNKAAKVEINDGAGNKIGSTGNALDVNIKSGVTIDVNLDHNSDSVLTYGNDGTNDQKIKTNTLGEVSTNVISSALPSGAATSALQTSSNTKSDTLHADNLVIEGKLDTVNTNLTTLDSDLNSKLTSTNTKLDTVNTNLTTIDTDLNSKLTSTNTKLDTVHSDLLVVEGKQDVSNTSLNSIDSRLTSQATATNQASTNTKLDSVNTNLTNAITEIGAVNEIAPLTDIASSGLNGRLQRVAQRLTVIDTDINSASTTNHSDLLAIKTDIDSTNTKLDTVNTNLTTIDTDIKASQPRKLQDGSGNAITSTAGALDVNLKSGITVDVNLDQSNDSVLIYGNDGTINRKIKTDATGIVQTAITSSSLPSGAATAANQTSELTKLDTIHTDLLVVEGKQDAGNTSLGSIDTKLTSQATAANQALANTKLDTIDADIKASQPRKMQDGAGTPITSTLVNGRQAIDIHQADSSFIVSGASAVGVVPTINPVSVSGVDAGGLKRHLLTDTTGILQTAVTSSTLPSGAATSVLQTTGNTSIASVDSKITTTANGIKVDVQASALPVGASTSANQTSMNTKLDTLHTDLLVVEGKQDIGNSSLSSIDTKLTSQATAANQATEISKLTSLDTKNVSEVNVSVTGTFTASDAVVAAPIGDGTLVSGASTAGSIVATLIPDKFPSWTLLIKGYVSGTIYTEASLNSTNGTDGDWIDIKGRKTGTAPGIESVTYAQIGNGYYRGNAAGFKYFRTRLIGGVGPSVQINLGAAQGATFLNSGIPTGGSVIGKVNLLDAGSVGLTSTLNQTTKQSLDVNPTSLAPGASTETTLSALNAKVTAVNTGAVVVSSSALPAGAATAANQSTEIASLASIVTNTANTTVTQATGTNLHTVVDSGTVTANVGTTNGLALDASLTTLNASVNSLLKPANTLAAVTTVGTVGAVTAITNALPAGANIIGAANVNVANASAVIVMQNAAVATGNGTSLVTTGYGTSVLQISGTFVASITFEASVDAGASWLAISATQIGQGDILNVATVPGLYRITAAGIDLIRARVTWTSGTSITINGRSSNAVNASKVVKLATGANTIGSIANITGAISLPTGAATSTKQSDGSQKTQITDAAGNIQPAGDVVARSINTRITDGTAGITSTLIGAKQRLDVTLASAATIGTPISSYTNTLGGKDTNGNAQAFLTDLTGSQYVLSSPTDSVKATYSASVTGLVIASAATDIFTITGSATKTVKISKMYLTGIQTTPGIVDAIILKRSTANSAGTSTTQTAVTLDSNDPAASAVVRAYTINPTLGTLVGNVRATKVGITQSAPANSNIPLSMFDFKFGDNNSKSLTLRGISQVVAINLNGQTLAGASLNLYIEWTEE